MFFSLYLQESPHESQKHVQRYRQSGLFIARSSCLLSTAYANAADARLGHGFTDERPRGKAMKLFVTEAEKARKSIKSATPLVDTPPRQLACCSLGGMFPGGNGGPFTKPLKRGFSVNWANQ